MWPHSTISAYVNLRQRVTKDNRYLNRITNDLNQIESYNHNDELSYAILKQHRLKSSLPEENGKYLNNYNLAIQFVEEHGINALKHGIVQLIIDQNDPEYVFSYNEKKMLHAFQAALKDIQIQSVESEPVENNAALDAIVKIEENEITDRMNTTKRSCTKVTSGTS